MTVSGEATTRVGIRKQSQVKPRIPTFRSIQEEAEFWDTHSTTEFEDEWEPVEVEIAPNAHSVRLLTVEIEYGAFKRLRDIAQQQGVSPEKLAEAWLMDTLARVSSETSQAASSTDPDAG